MNNALRVDVGYSTRSVSKLVEAGVIERAPNPADGRSNLLHLTQKGKEVSAFVEELVTEWDEEALSCLDPAEKSQLVDLLGRVVFSMGAQREYGN